MEYCTTYALQIHSYSLDCLRLLADSNHLQGLRIPKRKLTFTGGRQQAPSALAARLGLTGKKAGTAVYYDSLPFICHR